MDRVSKCAGVVLVMLFMGVAANAQIIADITINYPVPTGDFADEADPGFGAAGDVFVSLPLLPIKLGGRIDYESFKGKDDSNGGDTKILDIQPSVRYQLSLPFNFLSIWGQFGAGMCRWENDAADDTDFGLSAGIGVSAKVAPSINIVAMPMYHVIMAEEENLTYITANVGIQF